jgi:hypothetical protein
MPDLKHVFDRIYRMNRMFHSEKFTPTNTTFYPVYPV